MIVYAPSIVGYRKDILSQKSLDIISTAADAVNLIVIVISSTIRTPLQQATAMHYNLRRGIKLSYAEPGMEVTKVWERDRKALLPESVILQNMVDKIIELSKAGKRVSLHCVTEEDYRKLNIIDISIPVVKKTEFIYEIAKSESVVKILHDIPEVKDTGKIKRLRGEPCIHVEIKQ